MLSLTASQIVAFKQVGGQIETFSQVLIPYLSLYTPQFTAPDICQIVKIAIHTDE